MTIKLSHSTTFVLFMLLLNTATGAQAFVTQTTDFTADNNRTNFNGFEGLPDSPLTTSNYQYSEDGISVQQVVNPAYYDAFPDIWVASVPGGPEGANAWYPNAGDYGYTMLSMQDGSDFSNIGFLIGSGSPLTTAIMFELYNDGNLVYSGNVAFQFDFQFLGFSDGIFDTVLLRDTTNNPDNVSFLDRNLNTLSIDSIEVMSVTEPTTALLLLIGLIPVLRHSRKQRGRPLPSHV